MIVDCHTHWGVGFAQRDGEDPARWLATLDRHGVTHAVVLPHLGLMDTGRLAEDNDRVARVCARSGGRMIPFCTVHTAQGSGAIREARRCLDQRGHRGIKFHPWLQGLSPSDPVMDELAELAADRQAPILFHDGTPPFSLPAQIAVLARRHPRTCIILGHTGILEYWREAADAARYADNLWLCLSGPHVMGVDYVIRHADPDRLLWGTDFGFTPEHDVFTYRKPLIDQVPAVTPQLRQAMFENNPRRLLVGALM